MDQQRQPSHTEHLEFLDKMFRKAFKRGAFLQDGPGITHDIVVSFTSLYNLTRTIDQQNAVIAQAQALARVQQAQAQSQAKAQPAEKPCAGCDEKKDGKEEKKDVKQS